MEERPERAYIHPNLKNVLIELSNKINKESLNITNYPIPKGLPIASKIAAEIIKEIIKSDDLIKIEKVDNSIVFNTKIVNKITSPIYMLILSQENKKILFEKGDKEYLNLKFFKKKGIKENDIQFI